LTGRLERRVSARSNSAARPQQRQRSATAAAPATEVELHGADVGYLVALGLLVSVGLIMMYSATAVSMTPSDYAKMAAGLIGGGIFMAIGSRATPKQLRRFTPTFLFACVAALFMLFVLQRVWPSAPFIVSVNGATRWIGRPGLLTIQPSEYAKLAFVLFAAQYLDRNGQKMQKSTQGWAGFLAVLVIMAGLIYKEPDLGTALVIAGTAICMLVQAGIGLKRLIAGVLLCGAVVGILAWNTPHQRERLLSWWNPWSAEYRYEAGHQVIQSLSAMAHGGLTGVGLGKSINKMQDRLPESETDFVFAIVAEELGLVRVVAIIGLFAWLIFAGFGIAARAPDRYTSLVASGITSWLAVQTCLNLAVVTGSVPNTGVPLPFVSSGFSSLTALLAGAGIMTAISKRTVQEARPAGR